MRAGDHLGPYPHRGGCHACVEEFRCNACGEKVRKVAELCTNGRCADCHRRACTPGGDVSPGHGYGTPEAIAEAAAAKWADDLRPARRHTPPNGRKI